ncbi:MAG: hypothetical protein AAGF35_13555, partial [Pseudomonadota bacterium]
EGLQTTEATFVWPEDKWDRSTPEEEGMDSEQLAQSRTVRLLSSTTHEIWVQGLQAGDRVIVREPQPTLIGTLVHVNDLGEFAGTAPP